MSVFRRAVAEAAAEQVVIARGRFLARVAKWLALAALAVVALIVAPALLSAALTVAVMHPLAWAGVAAVVSFWRARRRDPHATVVTWAGDLAQGARVVVAHRRAALILGGVGVALSVALGVAAGGGAAFAEAPVAIAMLMVFTVQAFLAGGRRAPAPAPVDEAVDPDRRIER